MGADFSYSKPVASQRTAVCSSRVLLNKMYLDDRVVLVLTGIEE